MSKVEDFANNCLAKFLFTSKGVYGNAFKNLPEPFNEAAQIPYGDPLHSESFYLKELGLTSSLNSSFNIRKGIIRFIHLYFGDVTSAGYIYYHPGTQDLYTGYFDGDTQDYKELMNNASHNNRVINLHSNMSEVLTTFSYHTIDRASITENGDETAYIIGNNRGSTAGVIKHSASAYTFHMLCEAYFKPESANQKSISDCLSEILTMYENLEKKGLVSPADKEEYVHEFNRKLTFIENQLYVDLCLNSEGQQAMFPLEKDRIPSHEYCKDNDAKKYAFYKGCTCVYDTGFTKKVRVKKTVNVGTISNEGEYKIDDYTFAEGEEDLVPKIYDHYVPNKKTLMATKFVQKASELPERPVLNFMFTGEAGTGKSTATQIMARLLNIPYRFITMSADTTVSDLLLNILPGTTAGQFDHVESELVKAFRNGGIIEIQEVNTVRKPNVLTALNAALDDLQELHLPNGTIVKRHPNCVVVFTANIGYNGTSPMNQALLSRCIQKIDFELPDDDALVKMIIEKSGIKKSTAIEMVKTMHEFREILNEEGCDGICGFRELISWAKTSVILESPKESADITIISSSTFDEDVKARLKQCVANHFSA